jgi:DNA-directed RNA polymerase II subunit RPB1
LKRVAHPRDFRQSSRGVVFHPRGVKIHPPRVVFHSRGVKIHPRAVTIDPRAVTIDPRAVAIDPRAVAIDPRAVTIDPRAVTIDPRAVAIDPRGGKLTHARLEVDLPRTVSCSMKSKTYLGGTASQARNAGFPSRRSPLIRGISARAVTPSEATGRSSRRRVGSHVSSFCCGARPATS